MKKVVSILSIVAVLTMLMPISMGASFKFTPEISATRVEAGDTVTINLKLSEIDAGEKGINTFKCTFLYDTDIFEDVTMTSKNNWSINYNSQEGNEQYGTLLAVLIATGVTEDQDIGTITLHVKEGAEGKTGEITFTSISTNDGENEIPETDKIMTVTVNENQNAGQDEENNQVGNNEIVGNEVGNNEVGNNETGTGNNTVGGNNQNNTESNGNTQANKQTGNLVSQKPLPQTGIDQTILVIGILLSIVAIIFAYIQFRRNKDIK